MAKTTRKRKGGAYIGKGSYGCAFRPALLCVGNADRSQGSISKVMSKADAEKEFEIHDILSRLDPVNQYFLYPKRLCRVDSARIAAENRVNNCPLSNPRDPLRNPPRFRRNLSNARIVEYADGGEDLSKFKLKQNNYYEYFKGFENLLNGLATLHAAGYAHLDIKAGNVVAKKLPMDRFGNQPIHMRFIDFGFLSRAETLHTTLEPMILESMYPVWPADMLFTSVSPRDESKIRDPRQSTFYLNRYFDGAEQYYEPSIPTPAWDEIVNVSRQDWNDMFTAYQALGDGVNACGTPKPFAERQDCGYFGITKSQCEARRCCFDPNPDPNPDNVPYCYHSDNVVVLRDRARLRKYLPTVDIFSLGVLMAIEFASRLGIVWRRRGIKATFAVQAADQAWIQSVMRRIAIPYYRLIYKMIRMDFRKRISAQQALDEYRTLLPVMEELLTTENIRDHLAASFHLNVPSPILLPPSPDSVSSADTNTNSENSAAPPHHPPLQRQLGVRRLIGGKTKKRKT